MRNFSIYSFRAPYEVSVDPGQLRECSVQQDGRPDMCYLPLGLQTDSGAQPSDFCNGWQGVFPWVKSGLSEKLAIDMCYR
jgi:hypothetical protein